MQKRKSENKKTVREIKSILENHKDSFTELKLEPFINEQNALGNKT